jgi:hypothetical protein
MRRHGVHIRPIGSKPKPMRLLVLYRQDGVMQDVEQPAG